MPIPTFNISGVLPPFLGGTAGDRSDLMSPYRATVAEVVQRFSTTPERKAILAGWIQHRMDLRAAGLRRGFQWLDGSFLEDKESIRNTAPGDIDVIHFFYRPQAATSSAAIDQFVRSRPHLFDRIAVKHQYHVDLQLVDLESNPESLVDATRYFLLLFSHQRDSFAWKGLLEVRQEDSSDEQLLLQILAVTPVTP